MREVRVYDGDFPTYGRILAGDPTAVFPKEIWLQQVQPGEFAVRYKDFKTGLARSPNGEHVQSSEICRIFGSLNEARADSRGVANSHWTVRCCIYDHAGAQVGAISNNGETGKFALAMYAGVLLWLAIFTITGMVVIWVVTEVTVLALSRFAGIHEPLFSLGGAGWTADVLGGLILGVLAMFVRLKFIAKRRVERLHRNLESMITPAEKKRFEELNTLQGSKDPAERARFLKLAGEYRQKVREALKK